MHIAKTNRTRIARGTLEAERGSLNSRVAKNRSSESAKLQIQWKRLSDITAAHVAYKKRTRKATSRRGERIDIDPALMGLDEISRYDAVQRDTGDL